MVDGNLCDAACYKYLAARPVPRRTEPHARYRAGPKTQSTKRNVVAGGGSPDMTSGTSRILSRKHSFNVLTSKITKIAI